MSAEAMAHVFRCSPYRGTSAEHAVLVALADTVSDVHDNQVWMGQTQLSAKARVSVRSCRDAVKQLQKDGWLRLVAQPTPRDPARFEFVLRDREAVWEPRAVKTRRAREEAAAGAEAAAAPAGDAGPEAAAGEEQAAGQVRQELPPRGAPAAAEPKRTQAQPNGSASPPADVTVGDHLLEVDDDTQLDLTDPDGSFDAWWPRYPRQYGTGRPGGGGSKSKAAKTWRRMTVDQRRAAFVALPNYAADLAVTGTDVAHATTWLNQQRWEIHADPPDLTLDPVAEALVIAAGGAPDRVAPGELVDLARAARGLPEGTTAADVAAVVKAWRKKWPNADPSALGLVRHWHRFATGAPGGGATGPLCGACGQPKQGHDAEVCEMLRRAG